MHGSSKVSTTQPAHQDAEERAKKFTSWKLDLINALNADARIGANAFKVAVVIINHVNQQAGYAFPSVNLIAIKTRLPKRVVERALALLRKTGWLRSEQIYDRRTRTQHNRYWLLDSNLDMVLDEQDMLITESREARRESGHPRPPKAERVPTPAQTVAASASSGGRVEDRSACSGGRASASSGWNLTLGARV